MLSDSSVSSLFSPSPCGSVRGPPARPPRHGARVQPRQVRRPELREQGGLRLDRAGPQRPPGAAAIPHVRGGARAGLRIRLRGGVRRRRRLRQEHGEVLRKQGIIMQYC